jgi:hypothetical protein
MPVIGRAAKVSLVCPPSTGGGRKCTSLPISAHQKIFRMCRPSGPTSTEILATIIRHFNIDPRESCFVQSISRLVPSPSSSPPLDHLCSSSRSNHQPKASKCRLGSPASTDQFPRARARVLVLRQPKSAVQLICS